jgi:hypothetical protein
MYLREECFCIREVSGSNSGEEELLFLGRGEEIAQGNGTNAEVPRVFISFGRELCGP